MVMAEGQKVKPSKFQTPVPQDPNIYPPENGMDYMGHWVNCYGRCVYLQNNGVEATTLEQTAFLAGKSNDWLTAYARDNLSIVIPLVHPNTILIPLIMAVLFP
jgi:hypothetical protein